MTPRKKRSAPPPPPQAEVKQEIRRSPDFKSIYANWAQTSFSPYEITLLVGEATQSATPNLVEIEQRARITFSPLEAKLVMAFLQNVLTKYEGQYGRVAIPDIVLQPLLEQVPELKKLTAGETPEGV
jgi:Protein of unknown function (DUF3467)